MEFFAPIFTYNEYIHIQIPTTRNILELIVGAYDIDAAQSFKHFRSLIEGNNGHIRFVRIYDSVGGNANCHDIA